MRRRTHREPGRTGLPPRGLEPELIAERRLEDRIERDLRIPEDLACWPGHFSDWAIVPGALQLDWVMAGVARLVGSEVRLERIERLKFKQPLEPGDRATLTLDRDPEGGFTFRLADGEAVFSTGRLRIAAGSRGDA